MTNVIETDVLTKKYGAFTAVNKLSLNIEEGRVFGFLGPNGSGKSTTIRMLCGLIAPTSGTGHVLGVPLGRKGREIRKQIGYMSQKFSLYPQMTVIENLNLYAGLYALPPEEKKERIAAMLEMAGLTGRQQEYAKNLSGGWRQRLALGCAILHRPKILFLDEPTGGVDPKARQEFWDQIYDLAQEGTSIMVTTHFMDEAEHCDRVGFIYAGELIAEGTPMELKQRLPGRLYECHCEDAMRRLEQLQEAEHPSLLDAYISGSRLRVLLSPGSDLLADPLLKDEEWEALTPSMEDVFVWLTKSRIRMKERG